MASKRKFYRTRYTVEVLSEEPIDDDVGLASVLRECDQGDCVQFSISEERFEETGPTMAKLLNECGSDPGFFDLTDEGHDTEEEEHDGDVGPISPEPGRGSPD